MMFFIFLFPVIIFLSILILLHIGFIPPRIVEKKTPDDFGMKYKEFRIITEKGKKLFSWFIATEDSAPLILITHGWGSNAEHMLPIAETFHHAGLNVLIVDSRCHGKSDGDTFSALPRFSEDINHAVEYAKKELCFNGQIVLVGHSVGAGASLFSASNRKDISAVISISSFAHPQRLMSRYFKQFKLPKFMVNFLLFYIQWVIGRRFNDFAPVTSISKLCIPTLVVHGTDDTTIPIEDAQLLQKNNSNGYLLTIDGANHESVDKLETHGQLLIDFLRGENLL